MVEMHGNDDWVGLLFVLNIKDGRKIRRCPFDGAKSQLKPLK